MKKLTVVLMIVALVIVFAAPALAAGHGHPNIDPDKAGRANVNAFYGLHEAHHNVMNNSNGRASHVLHDWVIPHELCPCHPH